MKENIGVVWLRDDFRIARNDALTYASQNHTYVVAVYVFKKKEFLKKREAQLWWLYKSLLNFREKLKKFNVNLEICEKDSFIDFFDEIKKKKNFSLYWNKIYEPNFLNFDKKISKILALKKIPFKIFKGNILNENEEVKKNDNTPFKVFTPFWRTAEKIFLEKGFSKNKKLEKKKNLNKFLSKSFELENILPLLKWPDKFNKYWNPSEEEALLNINNFIKNKIENYGTSRDIPGVYGTSRISPYLAHGQIHVQTIWEQCEKIAKKKEGYRKFINELGWREFSHSLINYFPKMLKENLRKEFDAFPWVERKDHLKAWKKGVTGYPIVDAGMRELYETGWMHNRVRMITASFLVKHLRIHWKEGEKYFRNCLLDFNEANNVAGWQWVSGSGADAAPYFRIFNPILQGERFDKKGEYVKKWIPELSHVSEQYIHKPWEMEEKVKDYPGPIVDHQEAREKALKAFKTIKKNS
jgi:deoxyribodipyrimidine photo-lyase